MKYHVVALLSKTIASLQKGLEGKLFDTYLRECGEAGTLQTGEEAMAKVVAAVKNLEDAVKCVVEE